MANLLSSKKRVYLNLVIVVLMAFIGSVGGWVMGLVFGLVFSLLLELYSFIKDDTEHVIDGKLASFSDTLNSKFALLDDYKTLASDFSKLGIKIEKSALTDLFQVSTIRKPAHLTPAFILSSSIEPDIVSLQQNMFVLVPSHTQAASLFTRSFDHVEKSYWGTSFSRSQTWNLKSLNVMLNKHKTLIDDGVEIKRVFISHTADSLLAVKERAKKQRENYGIDCKYIDIETIKEKLPLIDTWNQIWSFYLRRDEPGEGKFIFLSPDFGIIDNKIIISYLLDFQLNEIGAAVYYEPDFLPLIIDYYSQLFEEASYP